MCHMRSTFQLPSQCLCQVRIISASKKDIVTKLERKSPKATEVIFIAEPIALEMLATEDHTSADFSARERGDRLNSKYPLCFVTLVLEPHLI